jgi:hypothetical protein
MIASTVWNQLKVTLENNPALSDYIKIVFSGQRFDIEPDSLPCIMIEPVSDGEIQNEMSDVKNVYLTVDIYALSSNNIQDFEKTIVGGKDYKGILDINNDIRACLSSSYDLGGNVIDTKLETTLFDKGEFNKYPIRGLLLPVRILYRQIQDV